MMPYSVKRTDGLSLKIGQPKSPGVRLGSHEWKRNYSGGEVYVNLPGATQPLTVNVAYNAKDLLTEKTGQQFSVEAGDGIILTRID